MTDVSVPEGEEDPVADFRRFQDERGAISVTSPKPFQGQGYNYDYGNFGERGQLGAAIAVAVAMQAQDAGLEPQGFYLELESDPDEIAFWENDMKTVAIEGTEDA